LISERFYAAKAIDHRPQLEAEKADHAPASRFNLHAVLTASTALGLDSQTKAEIDKLIAYVQTSGVRLIRNGLEYSGAEGAQHLRSLAKAGDRVKTTEDFITGIASKSFLSGKPPIW
jgi:hypothetical protein